MNENFPFEHFINFENNPNKNNNLSKHEPIDTISSTENLVKKSFSPIEQNQQLMEEDFDVEELYKFLRNFLDYGIDGHLAQRYRNQKSNLTTERLEQLAMDYSYNDDDFGNSFVKYGSVITAFILGHQGTSKLYCNIAKVLELTGMSKRKLRAQCLLSFYEQFEMFTDEYDLNLDENGVLMNKIETCKKIDETVSEYMKMVEAELYSINQQKIIYDIYNDDLLTRRFETLGIEYRISPFILDFKMDKTTPLPPFPFEIDSIKPEKTLKIRVDKTIEINETVVAENLLVDEFKKQIGKVDAFEYTYSENTKYQDFITVLSCQYKAAYELRKQEQTIFREYSYQYDEQYRDEQDMLKEKYPIRIMEKQN